MCGPLLLSGVEPWQIGLLSCPPQAALGEPGGEGMGQRVRGPGQPPSWGIGQGCWCSAAAAAGEICVRVRELLPKAWKH